MDDNAYRPHLYNVVAEVAGEGRAAAFCREYGGQRLSIPRRRRLGDGHPLVCALGWPAAERLCDLYGGSTIDVPLGPAGTLSEARRRTARALLSGASLNAAAAAGGLTRRTAQRMRRRIRETDQGELF